MNEIIEGVGHEGLLRHGEFLRGLARGLLRDEHLAEDLAQETLLRTLGHPPSDPARVRAWLGQVARNVASKWHRSRTAEARREQSSATPEALPSSADLVEHESVLRAVVDAVLALEEPYKSAILLRYYEGLPPREIAQRLHLPTQTVYSRLKRALRKLRERLDTQHGGETRRWGAALVALAGRETARASGPALTAVKGVAVAAAVVALVVGGLRITGSSGGETPAIPSSIVEEAIVGTADPDSVLSAIASSRSPLAASAGGIRLSGFVRDLANPELGLDEQPGDGLTVHIRWKQQLREAETDSFSAIRNQTAQAATGPDGAFEIFCKDPGVRPLRFHFAIKADEFYRQASQSLTLGEGQHQIEEIELRRVSHGVLRGRVIDEAGAPLPGAEVVFATGSFERAELRDTTDAGGAFDIFGLAKVWRPNVLLEGYRPLSRPSPRRTPEGGWKELVIVLARSGRLTVRVFDLRDEPVEGAKLSASFADSELAADGISELDGRAERSRATTSEDGIAVLDVWTGRKLNIDLYFGRSDSLFGSESGTMHDGWLVFGGDTLGQPVVVPPAGSLELHARCGRHFVVRGTVYDAEGKPVAYPCLEIHNSALDPREATRLMAEVQGGEDGRFSALIQTTETEGTLILEVLDDGFEEIAAFESIGYVDREHDREAGYAVSTVEVAWPDPDEQELIVDLFLEATREISGRLVDTNGEPVEIVDTYPQVPLFLVATGSHPHSAYWDSVPFVQIHRTHDGGFHAFGLKEGDWDLYLKLPLTGDLRGPPVLAGTFPAGAENLEIAVPDLPEVRVSLRCRAPDGFPVAGMSVLHGVLHPRDPREPLPPTAPRLLRVTHLTGWPDGAHYGFEGYRGVVEEDGFLNLDHYGTVEWQDHEVEEAGPGRHLFGVRAHGPNGELFFPMATELLLFEEGDYVIEFQLVRTGNASGRIIGAPLADRPAVSLADHEGRLLPLQVLVGYGTLTRALEAGADGSFVLRGVPAGEVWLRAGPRDELLRGAFRWEQQVVFQTGQNEAIEVPGWE